MVILPSVERSYKLLLGDGDTAFIWKVMVYKLLLRNGYIAFNCKVIVYKLLFGDGDTAFRWTEISSVNR